MASEEKPSRRTMGRARGLGSESERCLQCTEEASARCEHLGWDIHRSVVDLYGRSCLLGLPRAMASTAGVRADFGDDCYGSAYGFHLVEHPSDAVCGRGRIRATQEGSGSRGQEPVPAKICWASCEMAFCCTARRVPERTLLLKRPLASFAPTSTTYGVPS